VPVPAAVAAATLRARAEQERARAAARASAIRERLPAAAALLRARQRVEDVWLFGSLATGRPHGGSDVDLAVSARIGDYFATLADLADLLGCDVDLVELPTASDSLRARVLADGVRL
jgi:predicted nucleotidyltransferase